LDLVEGLGRVALVGARGPFSLCIVLNLVVIHIDGHAHVEWRRVLVDDRDTGRLRGLALAFCKENW